MENALRHLTDEDIVHVTEYAPGSDTNASEWRRGFVDVEEDVSESEHDVEEHIGESEQESHQFLPADRPVRPRRNRAKRRHGRSLGLQWMAARKPEERPEKHLLSELRVVENECPYCQAYQYPQECGGGPGSKNRYWHCCSNGRVHNMIVTPESDPDGLEALEDGEANALY